MSTIINDETIDNISILAQLTLSGEEKEQAKKDMGRMLDYIDKLNELDTTDVKPMTQVFPMDNVFRDDIVATAQGEASIEAPALDDADARPEILQGAPAAKGNFFSVPRTVE